MSKKRETKRVLIISPEVYPQIKVGGLGKMTAGVFRGLRDEGVEVKIVSPKKAIYGDLRSKKIKINYQKLGYEAVRQMDNWQPDWVWTHDWGGIWSGEIVKNNQPELKIMWTVHSPINCSGYGYGYGYSGDDKEKIDWGDSFFDFGGLIRQGVELADRTTTVSRGFAKRLMRNEWFEKSGEISGIGNGIDKDEWPRLRHGYGGQSWFDFKKANKIKLQKIMGLPVRDVPVFSFVSRIVRQKGVEWLIKVMMRVLRTEDCQLVILGKGERELEGKIKKLKDKYVEKVAIKLEANFEMPKLIFGGSDFMVLPSIEEPFGIVVAEAKNCGVIPIVSNVDGLRDQVTDGENGLVVRNSLMQKIYEAIALFNSEKQAQWCRLGPSMVDGWGKVSRSWLELMNGE